MSSRKYSHRADARFRHYLSNLKWLLMSLHHLPHEVENWLQVLAYYLMPVHSSALVLRFRNGDVLRVPSTYSFEAIAETTLMNMYKFSEPVAVVIDIGASVGDFTVLASRLKTKPR